MYVSYFKWQKLHSAIVANLVTLHNVDGTRKAGNVPQDVTDSCSKL